jgi:hypothetical protein
VAGKSDARGDLFGQMIARHASNQDAALHSEQRARSNTFARLFAKKKVHKTHKRSLSGDHRQSSAGGRKTEMVLQKARQSTAFSKDGKGDEAKSYQE